MTHHASLPGNSIILRFRVSSGITILILAIAPALLCAQTGPKGKKRQGQATAMTTTPATASTSSSTSDFADIKAPVATNMRDFAKTPQGRARRQQLSKNYDNKAGVKEIKYPDGSSLRLRMVKNPRFGDQPTEITAKVKSEKDKKPEQSKDAKGQTWNCTTDHVELTATSTTFLNNDYGNSNAHIYPGACYTFDNFNNGSYLEQAGARNPLTIVTDNTNIKGSPYRVVKDPNMATVRGAVDELFRSATRNTATESLTYQIYETSNDADQSIKISGGASGYGASLSGSYGTGNKSTTLNLTIDAIKTLFSITTVPPDNGFFTDPTVEATPNLMVIGSVSYGVRVLANLSVTFNSEQEAAGFAASYSGWGVSAHVDFNQLANNKSVSSTVNCYVVGGPGNSTVQFDKKDLEKGIEKIFAGATYKNAMPVKYEFYDMAG
ncbi:MAG TPA: thiol-activated cytolysin family protein, partial [Puia sp.]|nr:thiol-activated cytolysin family protein [Puia sp.]